MLKIILIIPLITIIINNFIKQGDIIRNISLLSTIIIMYINMYILLTYNLNIIEYQYRTLITMYYKYNIGIDGLNITLISLITIIIPIIIKMNEPMRKEKEYINWIIIIELILIKMFLTIDLFLFYCTYELILIPLFILIIKYGSLKKNIEAAYKLFLFTLLGSLILLIGIIYIYMKYNTFNYEILNYILNKQSFWIQSLLWFSFIISFLIKIPTFPFHIWLPFAHVQASTSVSVILAAILLKIGIYGIIKFNFMFFSEINIYYSPFIILLAFLSILFSLFLIIRLIDMKQIIAYSSIIHMNIFLIGLYLFNNISLQGSLLSLISHGLISSLLFILIGLLYNRYHNRTFFYYKGLCLVFPLFSFFFIMSILANISIPISSSFIGELLIIYGSINENIYITILLLLILIIGAYYSLWLNNRIIFGSLSCYISSFNDLTESEFYILLPLLFFTYLFGFSSSLLLNYFYLTSLFILF